MKNSCAGARSVRKLLPAFLVIASLAAPSLAQQHGGHGTHGAGHAAPGAGFAAEMHAAMTKMSRDMDATPMTGDPDKDFLAMMIPHHEGAVEMARLVLLHGKDPLVRKLAEDIIAGQEAEILTMRQRLAFLGARQDVGPGEKRPPKTR
jgi:uncharacterized protein (DUF305 family)